MAILALDFDHTIVNGDKPIEGAKEAINLLREQGHKILIHSCNNRKWIERVLNNNDIRYDWIWDEPGKPIADLYVDDRALHFEGDWKVAVRKITDRLRKEVGGIIHA